MPPELTKITNGTFKRKQTSFLVIQTDFGDIYRIDFKGKREHAIEGQTFDGFEISQKHPLLLDYQAELIEEIYINSNSGDVTRLSNEFTNLVVKFSDGHRAVTHYFNTQYGLAKLLNEGGGKLFRGPHLIGAMVRDLLERDKIDFTVFVSQRKKENLQALLLGRSYVIAESFKIKRMSGEDRY